MIVCICNSIAERDIRDIARSGIGDVREAYARMGCEPRCCQCLPFAAEILEEECMAPA
jgi:bacterioferritin-associated ferredoxin